jgi:hypothetical protein
MRSGFPSAVDQVRREVFVEALHVVGCLLGWLIPWVWWQNGLETEVSGRWQSIDVQMDSVRIRSRLPLSSETCVRSCETGNDRFLAADEGL